MSQSYSSLYLHIVFAWYYVHIVHKELQKMSILSIISMLWYPICTATAPKLQRRFTRNEEGKAKIISL